MADPVRLRILYALDVSEELCVGDLALALGANEYLVKPFDPLKLQELICKYLG